MIRSVLVVCTGNICRSPFGERLLARACPVLRVESAGLGAVIGASTDATTSEIAAQDFGIDLAGHVARAFTAEIGQDHELILAMEKHHRSDILHHWPQLSGRVMLFDHWTGAKGIDDPYRRPAAYHTRVMLDIARAADAWAMQLTPRTPT